MKIAGIVFLNYSNVPPHTPALCVHTANVAGLTALAAGAGERGVLTKGGTTRAGVSGGTELKGELSVKASGTLGTARCACF